MNLSFVLPSSSSFKKKKKSTHNTNTHWNGSIKQRKKMARNKLMATNSWLSDLSALEAGRDFLSAEIEQQAKWDRHIEVNA